MDSPNPLDPGAFLVFLKDIPASANAFTATADQITELRKVSKQHSFDAVELPLMTRPTIFRHLCTRLLYRDGGKIWYVSCWSHTSCEFYFSGMKAAYDVRARQCLTTHATEHVYQNVELVSRNLVYQDQGQNTFPARGFAG